MRVTVLNFKGGQGKTSIALTVAERYQLGMIVNEAYSSVQLVLEPDSYFVATKKLPDNDDLIFDFGGGVTPLMVEAVKTSDWVIIPTQANAADIFVAQQCYESVSNYSKNVIVVFNKIVVGDNTKELEAKFPNCKHFCTIHYSKAIENIYVEKLGIAEQIKKYPQKRRAFSKILSDYEKLFQVISSNLKLPIN